MTDYVKSVTPPKNTSNERRFGIDIDEDDIQEIKIEGCYFMGFPRRMVAGDIGVKEFIRLRPNP